MIVAVVAGVVMTASCEDGGATTELLIDAAVLGPPTGAADAKPPTDGAPSTDGAPASQCGTQTWAPMSCGATTCGAGQECRNNRCQCLSGTYGKNGTYYCSVLSSKGCVGGACRCAVYDEEGAGEPCGGRRRKCAVGVDQDVCMPDGRCVIGNGLPEECNNGITRMRGSRAGIAYQCGAAHFGNDGLVRIVTTVSGSFTTATCAAPGIEDFVTDGSRIIARIGSTLIACDGAGQQEIVSGPPITRFAMGGANVYWLTDANTLFVCPTSGCVGAPKALTTFASAPSLLEADASAAYVATGSSLVRVDAGSAAVTDLYSDGGDAGVIDAFAADDDTIWFTEGGTIFSCPKTGCAGARAIFATGAGPLSVDATRVWFVDKQLFWGCAKGAPCVSPAKAAGYYADQCAVDETTLYRPGAYEMLRFKKTFF